MSFLLTNQSHHFNSYRYIRINIYANTSAQSCHIAHTAMIRQAIFSPLSVPHNRQADGHDNDISYRKIGLSCPSVYFPQRNFQPIYGFS
jgi:hypothetical protein